MTLPGVSAITLIALAPLIAWRVYVRLRRATVRQRLRPHRGAIVIAVYVPLTAAVTVANLRHPWSLCLFLTALGAGGALAAYALRRTTFETTPEGLFFVPYAPIGLAIWGLFLVRLAYRFFEAGVADPVLSRDAIRFVRSPLTGMSFGMLAGYYVWYMLGLVLWWRGVRAARRAPASDRGGP